MDHAEIQIKGGDNHENYLYHIVGDIGPYFDRGPFNCETVRVEADSLG